MSPATVSAEGRQLNGAPFPATASAEGAQFNVPPFPATAWAEGPQLNAAPFPPPSCAACPARATVARRRAPPGWGPLRRGGCSALGARRGGAKRLFVLLIQPCDAST